MGSNRIVKILNLAIRGSSVFSKFFLIILITKFGSFDDLGKYSLFSTSILIGTFIIGIDFYNYTHREYSNSNDSVIFYKQFLSYLLIYFLIFIFFFLLLPLFDYNLLLYFFIILISEHFSQEVFRVLILLNLQILGNIFYFIRVALWIYIYCFAIIFFNVNVTFKSILISWFLFSILNLIISTFLLRKYIYTGKLFIIESKDLISWLKNGIQISIKFFLNTILFKLLEFQNRYILQYKNSSEFVGYFSFIQNINSIYITIVDVMFFSFTYSRIMNSEVKYYPIWVKQASKVIIYSGIFFIIFILLGHKYLIYFIKKPYVLNLRLEFFIIFLGNIFLNLSLVYHFLLYVTKNDQLILKATIFSFIFSFFSSFILIYFLSITGACISYSLTFLILFYYKKQFYKNYVSVSKV